MKTVPVLGSARQQAGAAASAILMVGMSVGLASAGANPAFTFYGYNEIVPDPNPAIVNQPNAITVTVSNPGDATATNVDVKLSFNDWGVTFQGWQEIGTMTAASIPSAGTGDLVFNHTFTTRAHTCLEALITDADQNDNTMDDRGQINLEVVNAGESFSYDVPIRNRGDGPLIVDVGVDCQDIGIPVECNETPRPGLPLPPGAEVKHPIDVVFPPGTVRGTQVEIIVEANDTAHPGDPAHTEHVRFIAEFQTAQGLKSDALFGIGLLGSLGDVKLDKLLTKAADKINSSLVSDAWTGPSSVAYKGGSAVMGQESAAIKLLLKLADSLTGEDRQVIEAILSDLVDAERMLASSAIEATTLDPAPMEQERGVGDTARLAGDLKNAVKSYRKAWKAAAKGVM